jgi:hypothetical protein
MGNKYVYNKHIAPVTARVRKADGTEDFVKVFLPERTDGTTGRVISTGYTALTGEEYDKLCKGSKTFMHYKDKLKLLSVSDDVPPEAKAPHEALADARRETRVAKAKIAEQEEEIGKLKARVLEAEDKYNRLASASLDEEKIKGFEDRIAGLTAAQAKAGEDYDALRKLSKVFVAAVGTAKSPEDAVKAANEFISGSAKLENERTEMKDTE